MDSVLKPVETKFPQQKVAAGVESPVKMEAIKNSVGIESKEIETPMSSTKEAKVQKDEPKGMESTEERVEELAKAEDNEPGIAKVVVYYGMDKDKKANPDKILFYEKPDGTFVDVLNGIHTAERPAVLDHLPSRPVNVDEKDLISAILNGVMDDKDYDSLDKSNILSDTHKTLWSKLKEIEKMNKAVEDLEKSEGAEEVQEDSLEPSEPEVNPNDLIAEILKTVGIAAQQEGLSSVPGVAIGEDLIAKLMTAATSAAVNNIQAVVRQVLEAELPRMLDAYISQMEQETEEYVEAPLGEEYIDESTEEFPDESVEPELEEESND